MGRSSSKRLAEVYLRYLEQAQRPDGRFRNRRSAGPGGVWDDAPGSDDAQGRALFGLAVAAASGHPVADRALACFERGAAVWESPSPRPNAWVALAAAEVGVAGAARAGAAAARACPAGSGVAVARAPARLRQRAAPRRADRGRRGGRGRRAPRLARRGRDARRPLQLRTGRRLGPGRAEARLRPAARRGGDDGRCVRPRLRGHGRRTVPRAHAPRRGLVPRRERHRCRRSSTPRPAPVATAFSARAATRTAGRSRRWPRFRRRAARGAARPSRRLRRPRLGRPRRRSCRCCRPRAESPPARRRRCSRRPAAPTRAPAT